MRFTEVFDDDGYRGIQVDEPAPVLRFTPEMLAWFGEALTLHRRGVFTIACENAVLTYELAGFDPATQTHSARRHESCPTSN